MTQNPFEIPEQLRQAAEKNVEQASQTYHQMMEAMTNAMGMWMNAAPSNNATQGFKEIQALSIKFANQNTEAGLALAKKIANAKGPQEVFTLQSQFAQEQMHNYAQQAQEMGKLISKTSQQSLKP